MSHQDVKDYYGKVLNKTEDLKTGACCTSERPPKEVVEALKHIHPEIQNHYYGCGIVIPSDLENLTVLDLGSGAGRDCYIISKLVGEKGHVIGVDMTQEQLDIANQYIDYHTKEFGYSSPNVEFRKGYIENLKEVGIQDNSIDLIISNCVVNLCPEKEKVIAECFRVLKEGGEMYFSDVYSERRVPEELKKDKVLYGECISGALYWNDFLNMAKKYGFKSPRLIKSRKIALNNKEIEEKVAGYTFYSATFRLIKCSNLEDDPEDFGDEVLFKGNEKFSLDKGHSYEPGKKYHVCRNTFNLLRTSRFNKYFDFFEGKEHLGIMEKCGKSFLFADPKPESCPEKSCCSSKKECCPEKFCCSSEKEKECCQSQPKEECSCNKTG